MRDQGHGAGETIQYDHMAVTYSLIGIDDMLDQSNHSVVSHFCRRVRIRSKTLSRDHGGRDVLIHDAVPAGDAKFANGYWYVHYLAEPLTVRATVRPTDQILVLLDRGRTA
jgi:hypothetical protein